MCPKGSINKILGCPCLLGWVVTFHPFRLPCGISPNYFHPVSGTGPAPGAPLLRKLLCHDTGLGG